MMSENAAEDGGGDGEGGGEGPGGEVCEGEVEGQGYDPAGEKGGGDCSGDGEFMGAGRRGRVFCSFLLEEEEEEEGEGMIDARVGKSKKGSGEMVYR